MIFFIFFKTWSPKRTILFQDFQVIECTCECCWRVFTIFYPMHNQQNKKMKKRNIAMWKFFSHPVFCHIFFFPSFFFFGKCWDFFRRSATVKRFFISFIFLEDFFFLHQFMEMGYPDAILDFRIIIILFSFFFPSFISCFWFIIRSYLPVIFRC